MYFIPFFTRGFEHQVLGLRAHGVKRRLFMYLPFSALK